MAPKKAAPKAKAPEKKKAAAAAATTVAAAARSMPTELWFVLFGLMAALRTRYALRAAVEDCDETFNYWEPAHFLVYGYGLQTWEYSPDFGLRSWLYVMAHSAPGTILRVGNIAYDLFQHKSFIFFVTRGLLAALSSYADLSLTAAAYETFDASSAGFLYLLLLLAPGCVQASFAFLPSSFTMVFVSLAVAHQLRFYSGAATKRINDEDDTTCGFAVLCVVIAVVVGWPFVGLACVPIALHSLQRYGFVTPFKYLVLWTVLFAGMVAAVDSMFYGEPLFSTWELVKYNVFGCLPRKEAAAVLLAQETTPAPDAATAVLAALGCARDASGQRGSHLYGVESPLFFFKNLLLNFGVAFPAALAAPVLLLLGGRFREVYATLPFALWFCFWLFIPHKEERFMTPVYSVLCLSAALLLAAVRRAGAGGSVVRRLVVDTAVAAFCAAFAAASVLRLQAIEEYYHAPVVETMRAIEVLPPPAVETRQEPLVCFGRDWYRFTSHFFVPTHLRIAFVDEGFGGLLPAYFTLRGGPQSRPAGFNDLNKKSPDQFTPLANCSYIVTSSFEGRPPLVTAGDNDGEAGSWELLSSHPILDRETSAPASRVFALHDVPPAVLELARTALKLPEGWSTPTFGSLQLLRRAGLAVAEQ